MQNDKKEIKFSKPVVVLCVLIIALIVVILYAVSKVPPQTSTNSISDSVASENQDTSSVVASAVTRTSAELAIENKGVPEFNPENDTINTVTAQSKEIAGELMPIMKAMGDNKDMQKNKDAIQALGSVISKHPDYSDAYFLRATLSVLVANGNYKNILSDIDSAIKLHSSSDKYYQSAYDSVADMYALRAKVDILSGDYQQAMTDLETAIKTNLNSAGSIFNSGGIKPEDTSNPTAIQKSDIDALIAKYPNDARVYVFKGLYYEFFTTFDKAYCTTEADALETAITTNPNSALAQYFLGREQTCDFLSTVEKASDSYRDQVNQNSLPYFKTAIKADPSFVEADMQMAETLLNLRRESEALPYYGKVIELNPSDAGAYNDRALAKTDLGDYSGAISDFTQAIKLKKTNPQSSFIGIGDIYENRASAYSKAGNNASAINDYSRAIGLKFASQVFIMSLPQIRTLYPEFNYISDKDLLEGLRQKYLPNMSPSDFAGNYVSDIVDSSKPKQPNRDFVLGDIYKERGYAYTANGEAEKASEDYARATYEGSTI